MADLTTLRKDLSNSKKQASALDAIVRMTKIDSRQNRIPVRKAGLVPGICAIVQKTKDDNTILKALQILVDLSVEDDNRIPLVQEGNVHLALADALKRVTPGATLLCVKCLVNLTIPPENRQAINAAGHTAFLLKQLNTKDPPEMQKWALWSLTNLALEESIALKHFNSAETLAAITAFVADGSHLDSRTRGVALLRNLSKHPSLGNAMSTAGVPYLATRLLRGGTFERGDSCEESALFILLRLSEHENIRSTIVGTGAILELKRVFQDYSEFWGLIAFMALTFLLEPAESDAHAGILSLTPNLLHQLTTLLRGVFDPLLMPPLIERQCFRRATLPQIFSRLSKLPHNRGVLANSTIVPDLVAILRDHGKDEEVSRYILTTLDEIAPDEAVHVHMFQDSGLTHLLQDLISVGHKVHVPLVSALAEKVKKMAQQKRHMSMQQKQKSLRYLIIDCLPHVTRFILATVDSDQLTPVMSEISTNSPVPPVSALTEDSDAPTEKEHRAISQIKDIVEDSMPNCIVVGLGPWVAALPPRSQKRIESLFRTAHSKYPHINQQILSLTPNQEALHTTRAVDFVCRQRNPTELAPSLIVLGLQSAFHVLSQGTLYTLPKPSPTTCSQAVFSRGREGVARVRSLWTTTLDTFRACHSEFVVGAEPVYVAGVCVSDVIRATVLTQQSLGVYTNEVITALDNTANELALELETAQEHADEIASILSLAKILSRLVDSNSLIRFHESQPAPYMDVDWSLGFFVDTVQRKLIETDHGDACVACHTHMRAGLLDPCGHVLCFDCAHAALGENGTCPVCQSTPDRFVSVTRG